MKATLLFAILVLLCSCASNKALSRQEAELRADVAIDYGLIIKDERAESIEKVLVARAPDMATTPKQLARLDRSLITARAAKTAAKCQPYATYYRQYNAGSISREEMDRLCVEADVAKQQFHAIQEQARIAAITQGMQRNAAQPMQNWAADMRPVPMAGAAPVRFPTDSPVIYDSQGNYRGKLNDNRYDPDSVANPYSRYGSRYSQDSLNNPYAPR